MIEDIFDELQSKLKELYDRVSQLEATPTVSSSSGGAPADAEYLTLAFDAILTQERKFTPTARFSTLDWGANGNYAIDLATTGVAAATYGNATNVAQVTVDAYGRLTTATNVAITGTPPLVHDLLGIYHGDTTTDVPTEGSIIYGNSSAPSKWDELVIGASGTILYSNGTVPSWSTLSSAGIAPKNCTYLVVSLSADLTHERELYISSGLTYTDLGANNNFVVALGTPSTTTITTTNALTASSHTHQLDLSGRTLTAGNGLTGGGALGANRTFTLGTPSNVTSITANGVTASSHTHALDTTGVGAGTYGSSGQSAQIIVDVKGRVTSATNIAITGTPAAPHALLGPIHNDTTTDAPTRGSLIYGNGTNTWDELVLGGVGNNTILTQDGTDVEWSDYLIVGWAGKTLTFQDSIAFISATDPLTVTFPITSSQTNVITTTSNAITSVSTVLAGDGSGDLILSNLAIADYISHYGDTSNDTYLRFQEDQITLVAGGNTYVDIHDDTILFVAGAASILDIVTTYIQTYTDVRTTNGKYVGINGDVQVIFNSTSGYIDLKLDDAIGADKVRIVDSGSVAVTTIDSDGDIITNNLAVADYVSHAGDVANDTFIHFQEDQITLVAGTDTYIDIQENIINVIVDTASIIDFVEGATDYVEIFTEVRLANQEFIGINSDVQMVFDSTSGNIDMILGDAAGADELRVLDSGLVARAGIDSDGNGYFLGNVHFSEYLYHHNDTDTSIRFETDEITLRAGAVDMISIVESTTNYVDFPAGITYINGAANITPYTNAFMTRGLTINMGTNDNEIISLKSSDVAHGMTSLTGTDTFGVIKKQSGATGGVSFNAFSMSGIAHQSIACVTTENTTKSAAANACYRLYARKKSGTTYGDFSTTAQNLWVLRGRTGGADRAVAIFGLDGDLYLDTVVNENAWDDYDDGLLLHGLRASLVPDGHAIQQRFGQWINYARPILEQAGIVHYNEDGHHFIATKKLQMLTIDAVRQLYERINILESRLKILTMEA